MSTEERADTQKILERLTNYIEPKQNIIYQRYMFNSCTQEQGEKFDAYLTKLRHLIKTYEYGALGDELLHDVRARLLSESGLALGAIDICRSSEQAEQQLGKLNNSAETIHYTKADFKKKAREFIKDCKFCGKRHDKRKCQAYGLTCAICLKRNHIARVCQSLAQPTPPQQPNKSSTQRTPKVCYLETEAVSSDESI